MQHNSLSTIRLSSDLCLHWKQENFLNYNRLRCHTRCSRLLINHASIAYRTLLVLAMTLHISSSIKHMGDSSKPDECFNCYNFHLPLCLLCYKYVHHHHSWLHHVCSIYIKCTPWRNWVTSLRQRKHEIPYCAWTKALSVVASEEEASQHRNKSRHCANLH